MANQLTSPVIAHAAFFTHHKASERDATLPMIPRLRREGEGLIPFLYKFTKKLWLSLDRFMANKKNVRIVKKY